MGEPLKSFFNAALVERLAADVHRVYPAFAVRPFVRDATRDLESLELLDRGRHIAQALAAYLPPLYPDAVAILVRSLGPEHATDELIGVGMAPFFYLPHTLYVADRGLDHFDLSMHAQFELTKRFSAESSIRAFIARDPEKAWAYFEQWATDANAHVRRLVSEGTRLRLPWAPRVPWLDSNPARIVSLLERLKDDPSTMVRRSVANNLNDLGRVHPDLLTRTARAWLVGRPTPGRLALVEHALRGAVKRGDRDALTLLGFGEVASVGVEKLMCRPRRVPIGGAVRLTFDLVGRARTPQHVLVDVAVHFVKARGTTGKKVFKLGRHIVAPHTRVPLDTRISLAVHTTRVPRPGRHLVDVIANGTAVASGSFVVTESPRRR